MQSLLSFEWKRTLLASLLPGEENHPEADDKQLLSSTRLSPSVVSQNMLH
jgi:hypothetical protein